MISPVIELDASDGDTDMSKVRTHGVPVVLKNCSFGDCMRVWNLDYLTRAIGDQSVVIHKSASSELEFLNKNFTYETCKFSEFSRRLRVPNSESVYLRSVSNDGSSSASVSSSSQGTRSRRPARIEEDFPMLAPDLKPPSWVPFGHNDLYHSSVLRIASERVQIWTHFDLYDNILCQVAGSKRIALVSPASTEGLYVEGDKSPVNCFDDLDTCLEKFPLMKEAHIQMATLRPGECIFIPSLWWHNIRSLTSRAPSGGDQFTIGFNIFWRDQELAGQGGGGCGGGCGSLYAEKDIYGNKNLVPYDAALTNFNRALQHLDRLPEKYKRFYKIMLLRHIEKKLSV